METCQDDKHRHKTVSSSMDSDIETAALQVQAATKRDETSDLVYSLEDSPPLCSCFVLGLQHYLVAVDSLVALPLLIAGHMCVPGDDAGDVVKAQMISSLFFVAGVATILQTTVGIRLPIVQGASAAFIAPAAAILSLPHNKCPLPLSPGLVNSSVTQYNDTDGSVVNGEEVWMRRMREVQGAIAAASLLQVLLGLTGAIGFLLRYIGPLTVVPAVSLVGLDFFRVAHQYASVHWGIAMFGAFVVILCSQYLKNIQVPVPTYSRSKKCHITRFYLFKMYPVIIGLVSAWILSLILTVTNVFPTSPDHPQYKARTDISSNVIFNAPWFRFPYPGQWGLPRVTVAGVAGMLAGVIAGIIESVGDYYACAKLSGAPNPPRHAINRGILVEGLCCMFCALIGTGTGMTSYSQNIGAIGLTRVASRKVLQVAGFMFMLFGLFSKFGSVFVTMPDPVIGGVFCIMFGVVTATGLSNLQYVDLNSRRNLFIIGFSLFMGLVIPNWARTDPGSIQTGVVEIDQLISVLLQTSMLIGALIAFVFDNTIPGSHEERGLLEWESRSQKSTETNKAIIARERVCYDLPFRANCFRFCRYLPFLPQYERKMQTNSSRSNTES